MEENDIKQKAEEARRLFDRYSEKLDDRRKEFDRTVEEFIRELEKLAD